MYQPKFSYSQSIVKDLMSIERSLAIVELMPISAHIESDLKEQAKLKATHYSTRIEGNTLDLEQVARVVKEKQRKTLITEDFIKELHSIIVKHGVGRRSSKSNYRGAMPPGVLFAVYDNQTRQPEYSDVPPLMEELVNWINTEIDIPIPIIATYQLLTFHPFEDGNG